MNFNNLTFDELTAEAEFQDNDLAMAMGNRIHEKELQLASEKEEIWDQAIGFFCQYAGEDFHSSIIDSLRKINCRGENKEKINKVIDILETIDQNACNTLECMTAKEIY